MNLPYTNRLRRGMPKSRHEKIETYDATVRGMVIAGLAFGALMVLSQAAILVFDWSKPSAPTLQMTREMKK